MKGGSAILLTRGLSQQVYHKSIQHEKANNWWCSGAYEKQYNRGEINIKVPQTLLTLKARCGTFWDRVSLFSSLSSQAVAVLQTASVAFSQRGKGYDSPAPAAPGPPPERPGEAAAAWRCLERPNP